MTCRAPGRSISNSASAAAAGACNARRSGVSSIINPMADAKLPRRRDCSAPRSPPSRSPHEAVGVKQAKLQEWREQQRQEGCQWLASRCLINAPMVAERTASEAAQGMARSRPASASASLPADAVARRIFYPGHSSQNGASSSHPPDAVEPRTKSQRPRPQARQRSRQQPGGALGHRARGQESASREEPQRRATTEELVAFALGTIFPTATSPNRDARHAHARTGRRRPPSAHAGHTTHTHPPSSFVSALSCAHSLPSEPLSPLDEDRSLARHDSERERGFRNAFVLYS